MIQYGLISRVDAGVIEKTLDLVCQEFNDIKINITEVGVYSGATANGMEMYLKSKERVPFTTGVDNNKDGEHIKFGYHVMLHGDSGEVAHKIENNSQHLIFIDGDHSYLGVIKDFYAYSDKAKEGGYLAFHDTGKHIRKFKDFQHGYAENPDAYISVRRALKMLGLIDAEYKFDWAGIMYQDGNRGWDLIFDEADTSNEAGGICVFKKLY
jgi:hypothetical protein